MLKKRYRQLLQEKEAKHPSMDGDGQRHPSPTKAAAAARWDAGDGGPASRPPRRDEAMSCAGEVNSQTDHSSVNCWGKKTKEQEDKLAGSWTS